MIQQQLFPFQQRTVDWLVENPRSCLANDMGLGKTACAISAVRELYPDKTPLVVIVCGLRKAFAAWNRDIPVWAPDIPYVLYRGDPSRRRKILKDLKLKGFRGFIVTTAAMLKELAKVFSGYHVLVVDEGHMFTNRKSQGFKELAKVRSRHFYWVTATPDRNGHIQDLWTALHLMYPKKFSSYWRFVNEHCLISYGPFGQQIVGPSHPIETRAVLSPYFFRVTKKDAGIELPKKWRRPLHLEMTDYQKKIYQELAEDLVTSIPQATGEDHIVLAPNQMTKLTRLRQLLITPALLGGDNNESAALQLLLERLDESREPCVIFTPFVQAFQYIKGYLSSLVPKFGYIHSKMTDKQFEETIATFRRGKGLRVLISSIRSAASWEVPEISTAYFLQYDWVPGYNRQAEDRLHRLTTVQPVFIWYLTHADTADEHVMDVLDDKVSFSRLLYKPRQLFLPETISA